MKRLLSLILIMLLCLPLLTACQPTPEDDFVVNKGDDTVDDKVNATQAPASPEDTEAPLVPQFFPDRWDEEPGEAVSRVTVKGEAEVLTRADGLYPVYRTASKYFSAEEVQDLLEKLFGMPTAAASDERTKDYYESQLQGYLNYVEAKKQWFADGCPEGYHFDETPITDEEIRETTARIMSYYNVAPEKNEETPVSDWSELKLGSPSAWRLGDGSALYVKTSATYLNASAYSADCVVWDEAEYEDEKAYDENVSWWRDVTSSREAAEAELERVKALLGLDDFSVVWTRKANVGFYGVWTSVEINLVFVDNGWLFELERTLGYPVTEYLYSPSQWLKYAEGDGFDVAPPAYPEHIRIFINEDGLKSFYYDGPKEIMEVSNPNVELLSFDEVKQRVKNAFVMCFPYDAKGLKANGDFVVNVYRMLLTTCTVSIKDKVGRYEMPCWIVFYDCDIYGHGNYDPNNHRNNPTEICDVLVINAVDGSIIHNNY